MLNREKIYNKSILEIRVPTRMTNLNISLKIAGAKLAHRIIIEMPKNSQKENSQKPYNHSMANLKIYRLAFYRNACLLSMKVEKSQVRIT